jgi:DHA1 family multidrug resistance protein-like MFS transporter
MGRPLWILYACLFVAMIGYGITVTILPYYGVRIHGLSGASQRTIALHVGILTSVYALAQLVASPFIGRLGDRVGRRPVLLAGLVGMALTQVTFGLTSSLPILYALRVLSGLATAALLVAASASVADLTSEADRVRGMAWFATAVSLGFVAGPVLGGVLSRPGMIVGPGNLRVEGYELPFFAAGLLALIVFFIALWVVPESEGASARSKVRSRPAARGRLLDLGSLLALVAVSSFGLALFEGTFVLFNQNRMSLSPARAGLVFMVCGLVMAVLQVWAVKLFGRHVPPLLQVAVGLAMMGSALALLVTTTSFSLVLVLAALLAAGSALITPNLWALVSSGGAVHTGAALGLNNAATSLGQFVGPLLGSILLGWHASSPFLLGGALLMATGAIVGFARLGRSPNLLASVEPDVDVKVRDPRVGQ